MEFQSLTAIAVLIGSAIGALEYLRRRIDAGILNSPNKVYVRGEKEIENQQQN